MPALLLIYIYINVYIYMYTYTNIYKYIYVYICWGPAHFWPSYTAHSGSSLRTVGPSEPPAAVPWDEDKGNCERFSMLLVSSTILSLQSLTTTIYLYRLCSFVLIYLLLAIFLLGPPCPREKKIPCPEPAISHYFHHVSPVQWTTHLLPVTRDLGLNPQGGTYVKPVVSC